MKNTLNRQQEKTESFLQQTRKFEVKTPDVVIKVNPERTDLVETMMIEGRQCLVIQIDEHLEVNGITVNPNTGEVIMNDTY